MRLQFLIFIILIPQQNSLRLVDHKVTENMSQIIEGVRQLAIVSGGLKLSVWYSPEQTDWISLLLKVLDIPVIVNSREDPEYEGLDRRRPSDLVILLSELNIDNLFNDTLWTENTRFLVLSQNTSNMRISFKKFWEYKVVNIFHLIQRPEDMVIYGFLPYAKDKCDSEEIVIVDLYLPDQGNFKNGGLALRDPAIIKDMNGCLVNITIVKVRPMTLMEDGVNATHHLDGIEGNLMHAVAEKLNFNATFVTALDGIGWGWIRPSPHGAVGEVFTGRSDFAIGLLAPTTERYENLDLSVPYSGKECITYGIPNGVGVSTPYWITILVSEYTPITWFLICLFTAFTFCIFYIINKYLDVKLFSRTSDIFLYEFSSCMGLPIKIPERLVVRIIVITWILYSFVITVAYKSEISSKLTVQKNDPDIDTFEELVQSPLELMGYNNMLRLLDYNDSDPAVQKMVDKFKVTDFDINFALDKIAEERKIAYMSHTSTFLYYSLINSKAKGNVHVMTDCILSYYPIVVEKKNSPFRNRLDQLISRLAESGITNKWRSDYIHIVPPNTKPFLKLSPYHMYGVFCILVGGQTISLVLLVVEILSFHCRKPHDPANKLRHVP